MDVRLKVYLTNVELINQLDVGPAKPESIQRRLRRHGLLTAGTPVQTRRSDGRVAGEQRRYSILNVLSAALVQAGRGDEAAAAAEQATRFEVQHAGWLDPNEPSNGEDCRRLSDALEHAWSASLPQGVTELRGVVSHIDDWVHVRTGLGLAEVVLPRTAPLTLSVGDGVVVLQIASKSAGAWLSRLLPTQPVKTTPDEAGAGLFGDGHIERVTLTSPERAEVFDRLARLSTDREPSRLTLLA